MFKVVYLQLGATGLAVVLSALLFDLNGGLSAGLAGLACVVPNALFAWRLSQAQANAFTFFVGEFFKVFSIVALLMLIGMLYRDLHWGAVILGMVLALKANLFAFLVKV